MESEKASVTAIIVESGEGDEKYNPGTRLLGLSVIERAVFVLASAGVDDVLLWTRNKPEFSRPNPVPVRSLGDAAGVDADKSRFILLPADLVFHRSVIEKLIDNNEKEIGFVRSVSKAEYSAMAQKAADGEYPEINFLRDEDGQRPESDLKAFEARVADRAGFIRARKLLLESLKKNVDGIAARYVNRPISLFITRFLTIFDLHPNHLTPVIMLIGLLSGILAAHGGYWWFLAGALLLQLQSILDGCDGELARITFRTSKLGQWLDTIGDDFSNYVFLAGLATGLYRESGWWGYALLGVVTLASTLSITFFEYRYLIRAGSGDLCIYPTDVGQGRPGPFARIVSRLGLRYIVKRDFFVLANFIVILLGRADVSMWIFAVGAVSALAGIINIEIKIHSGRLPHPKQFREENA